MRPLGSRLDRRYTAGMKLIQTLIFSAACILSLSASAQWQWIDKDGHKVFSDRPPSSDVPEKNILKRPRQYGKATGVPAAALPTPDASGATAQAQGGTSKPAGADKELMDKKKQAEKQAADAEAAKRKAEEERVAKIQAENCSRARQSLAGISSGVRMTRTNEKGEREFLDDAARAEEARRTQAVIDQDCK
jgi:type IV secretory pathway VirB10-like protein